MSRISKISPQEMEQACLDYLHGESSISELSASLHVNNSTIRRWGAIYKKHGISAFIRKTKNRSYSKEFKEELVRKYISGENSSLELSSLYNISDSVLLKWIRLYNANIELKDYMPIQEVYMAEARRKTTIEERIQIVKYCIDHNRNYKETAKLYDVSYSQVYSWVRKYDRDGEDRLKDWRGRHKSDTEVDELKRLRRENKRLKHQLEEKDIIVELLKKVRDLGRM